MNIVDTSGWLQYFMNGPYADFFQPVRLDTSNLIVSTVNIYEVSKVIRRTAGDDAATRAIGDMLQAEVIDLNAEIAVLTSRISIEENLPLADSVILVTAMTTDASLWTQVSDFEGIEGVEYISKP